MGRAVALCCLTLLLSWQKFHSQVALIRLLTEVSQSSRLIRLLTEVLQSSRLDKETRERGVGLHIVTRYELRVLEKHPLPSIDVRNRLHRRLVPEPVVRVRYSESNLVVVHEHTDVGVLIPAGASGHDGSLEIVDS